jgi:hypothetical protein
MQKVHYFLAVFAPVGYYPFSLCAVNINRYSSGVFRKPQKAGKKLHAFAKAVYRVVFAVQYILQNTEHPFY